MVSGISDAEGGAPVPEQSAHRLCQLTREISRE